MNTRRTKSFRSSSERGFTLIEVLAALLIAAVALTFVIQSETTSVRLASDSRELREATLLANAKLQELIAGVETAASGTFEEPEGWTWEAAREPFLGGYGTQKVSVSVRYESHGAERLVTLEQVTR